MTKIYIVRHAEAEGNLYRRIQGVYDSLVTPNGRLQIEALKARFEDVSIDAVYSSDLYRARATAGAIHGPKQLPLNTRADLREVHMGRWEDMPWGEATARDGEQMRLFNRASDAWDVGGETLPVVRARMLSALREIAAAHSGQTVAVVSHGSAIRSLLGAVHGYDELEMQATGHCDNTGVSCVEIDGENARVIFENDNSHLPSGISTLARQKWWRGSDAGLDANLWFRPLDLNQEADLFCQARREAWQVIHGDFRHFDGDGFLRDAMENVSADRRSLWCAMMRDTPAGVLQLNLAAQAGQGVGRIPFFYMLPEFRKKGLGVQLLGQAISVYRPLGRRSLRLRCAPDNHVAQRFYARWGFVKVAEDEGSRVPLDILEIPIEVPR